MNSTLPANSDQFATSAPCEEGIFEAELSDDARRKRRRPRLNAILLLLFAVGATVPVLMYLLPSERARWQIAAAQAKWLEGDLAGAKQIMDAAASEFPDRAAIYEQRYHFDLEAKEFDKALADVQRLETLLPESIETLGKRSEVLQHLGRHDEAIKVCRELLRLADEEWIGSAPNARNAVAYALAIGDTQLDEAMEHITEALRLSGDNPAMLDTRGFVLYRRGDSKAARDDLERAVASWEKITAYQRTQQLSGVRSYESEVERESYEHSLAVMLYHRSLVYEQLRMRAEAKVDRERVRGLGYEPNERLF